MGDAHGASHSDSPADTARLHSYALVALARSGFLDGDHGSIALWQELQLVSRSWRDTIASVVLARHTLLVTHAQCARHHIPRRAERPERLSVVMDRLLARLPRIRVSDSFAPATIAQLTRFHSDVHVDSLHKLAAKIERSMAALDALQAQEQAVASLNGTVANGHLNGTTRNGLVTTDSTRPSSSHSHTRADANKPKGRAAYYAQFEFIDLDDDTILMRHTLEAALLAAGGVCHAVDRVLSTNDAAATRTRNAFCVVRPPGHHAEPQKSMGFCFFNNIGVAAFHALDAYALSRVAIIDFDVHHGNGTQKRVESEPRLLYVSLHQSPLYPHSGFARETGKHGNIVNIPLPARSSGAVYRQKFLEIVWPRVAAFAPQLVLVSAGFDGHASDPLSDMKLQAHDFYWLTNEIVKMAWQSGDGKVVSVLEGGYNATALAESAEQHVLALVHGSIQHGHRSSS